MVEKLKQWSWLGLALLMFGSSAYADGLTFGAKSGPMMIDHSGFDDPINAGIAVGTELGVVLGDIGVEGEFTTTMSKGSDPFNNDISIDTMAVYATYRSPGFIYLKGRGGFLRWDSEGQNDTTTSFGIGIGFSLAVVKIELEYTKVDSDINFLSIGVQF